ncbi:MAG: quinone-dependent dihydroorotate dehydrogenase [Alphaproteobacteria bacterium]
MTITGYADRPASRYAGRRGSNRHAPARFRNWQAPMPDPFPLIRPLLFRLEAEAAHRLIVRSLTILQMLPPFRNGRKVLPDPLLRSNVFGMDFPNPLGLAAGFDKNAEVVQAMFAFGFGFVEAGTVTPRPQAGNPRPRIFRLERDLAVINRLGFNNEGIEKVRTRLSRLHSRPGILGVNIGANRDSADRPADYIHGLSKLYSYADYFTVNVSSPNTPGLRGLQERGALEELLHRLMDRRADLTEAGMPPRPLLLKVAPDLDDSMIGDIAAVALGAGIDGLVVGNTTVSRPPGLHDPHADEAGGLSGAPLLALSTSVLRRFYEHTEGRLPLVGAGGVSSGRDAYEKIRAGASLVQLYTALIYDGPGLVRRILNDLRACLQQDGFTSVADAVGAESRSQ